MAELKPGPSRASVEALLQAQKHPQAASELRALWRLQPSLGLANFVRERCLRLGELFPAQPKRIAILRSYTVEPMLGLLRTEALLWGLDLTVWVGGYDTFLTELLDPDSELGAFTPDVVLLWAAPPANFEAPEVAGQLAEQMLAALTSFRQRQAAPVIMHDFDLPAYPLGGLLDSQRVALQQTWNRELLEWKSQVRSFYPFPYDQLVARHGRLNWLDPAKLGGAGLPVKPAMHIHLVREWLKFTVAALGRQSKVVVTDLDNTLWQGVLGEDGRDGIRPHYELQHKLLELRRQGFLLALCSKNDWSEVEPALESGMPLKTSDFSARRVNWQDKASNLVEIAAELNLGVDSLAFIDDSPFEREQVRAALPAVTVVDLPDSPALFRLALEETPTLHRLELSREDESRAQLYQQEQQRQELQGQVVSLSDYLHSLQLQLESRPVDGETILRASQLTQKTNQFNLTTRRYSQADILQRCQDPAWRVLIYRAVDRFGDYGWIGLAMAHRSGDELEIDTFLVSCRALKRGLETAMLALLLKDSDARLAVGHYLPTAKNGLCADFLSLSGFQPEPGDTRWKLDLSGSTLEVPSWIEVSPSSV